MEVFLMKAAQLIVALAFLVIIHEFGHYIIARAFGIKVEKFYLFFNPGFSLFKWKPKSKKHKLDKNGNERASWRDTEYGIGWLPLGGYVKIAGMIDESMDKDQMAQPVQPWEFRAKPAYQRLCVMLAGVVFNFVLAIIIYAGIAFHWGAQYLPLESAYEGMDYSETAKKAGFQNGDIPVKADGQPVDIARVGSLYYLADAKEATVLRKVESDSVLFADGRIADVARRDTVTFALPEEFLWQLNDDKNKMMMTYRLPVFVQSVVGGSAAAKAGIMVGDRLVAVGGVPTPSYSELTQQLSQHKDQPTQITLQRDGKILQVNATPDSDGKLGFQLKPMTEIYPVVYKKYSLIESVPQGWRNGTDMLGSYVSSMSKVFSRHGVESIGGFGSIGSLFPEKWNWLSFWQITAFLSVVLAFMNLIPIPGLDGGHVLFLLWEVITRRKVNEKVMEWAQYAGMAFLLLLLVYANGKDLIRAFL